MVGNYSSDPESKLLALDVLLDEEVGIYTTTRERKYADKLYARELVAQNKFTDAAIFMFGEERGEDFLKFGLLIASGVFQDAELRKKQTLELKRDLLIKKQQGTMSRWEKKKLDKIIKEEKLQKKSKEAEREKDEIAERKQTKKEKTQKKEEKERVVREEPDEEEFF